MRAAGVFLADLYALDTATIAWTIPATGTLANSGSLQPPARVYHGLASAGGLLYVHGGAGADGTMPPPARPASRIPHVL